MFFCEYGTVSMDSSLRFPLSQVPGLIQADDLELSISTYVGHDKVTLYLSSDQQPFVFAFPGKCHIHAFLVCYRSDK